MAEKNLEIRQGDSDTLTEVVTELSSLSGYTAKLYIYDPSGTLKSTITGTISDMTVTHEVLNDTTKVLSPGPYDYEAKKFDASDHVYTTSWGKLVITPAKNSDPS